MKNMKQAVAAVGLCLVLSACVGPFRKKDKQDQTYSISFQKQDKVQRERPAKYTWQEKTIETVGDNFIRGEIKGISDINNLTKLKELLETLKFIVLPSAEAAQKGQEYTVPGEIKAN